MTIHEPAVVVTDLALALLGGWFARRLFAAGSHGPLDSSPAILMAGLASAAFWGAIFHSFFPDDTATPAGFLAWVPVMLSIVVAAAALLDMALRAVTRRMTARLRLAIVAAYALAFALTVVFVDESFTMIVRFYGPALLLFLAAAAIRALWRGAGWGLIATGLALSVCAAMLQQFEIALHPTYFDHNAVYHVVQAVALVVLYLGFRRVATTGENRGAPVSP